MAGYPEVEQRDLQDSLRRVGYIVPKGRCGESGHPASHTVGKVCRAKSYLFLRASTPIRTFDEDKKIYEIPSNKIQEGYKQEKGCGTVNRSEDRRGIDCYGHHSGWLNLGDPSV